MIISCAIGEPENTGQTASIRILLQPSPQGGLRFEDFRLGSMAPQRPGFVVILLVFSVKLTTLFVSAPWVISGRASYLSQPRQKGKVTRGERQHARFDDSMGLDMLAKMRTYEKSNYYKLKMNSSQPPSEAEGDDGLRNLHLMTLEQFYKENKQYSNPNLLPAWQQGVPGKAVCMYTSVHILKTWLERSEIIAEKTWSSSCRSSEQSMPTSMVRLTRALSLLIVGAKCRSM